MKNISKHTLAFLVGLGVAVLVLFGVADSADQWTGNPATPQRVNSHFDFAHWDVQVHNQGQPNSQNMHAEHGSDCGAPPATHPITAYEDAVFVCKDHLMTAINGTTYGLIALTPDTQIDMTNGGVVSWEVSTQRMSQRDWWDVWITPWADNLTLPFNFDDVDLQGTPRNAIQIAIDSAQAVPILHVVRNGIETVYGNATDGTPAVHAGVLPNTNQAAARQPFRLTIANGHIKFERLATASGSYILFWDHTIPLPFTKGVVTWGHHSYNPTKDGAGVPATWHWDNMEVSPAVPFTMIKGLPRQVANPGGNITFASPAPANAYIRFSAICRVRIDGVQVERQRFLGHPEHFSSYFVPIAQGKTSVNITFANDDWYQTALGCWARDFAIWSQTGGVQSTPTPQPATATATLSPPTSTSTPLSTSTSTAIPSTSTPIPTSTTAPLPTATAVPVTATLFPATPTPQPTGNLNRLRWLNQDWFASGANLPWYNWSGDFGGGQYGVVANSAVIDAKLAQFAANGGHTLRWWVFPGDPWQLDNISVTYADFDEALRLAAKHNIYMVFVLYSDPSAIPQSPGALSSLFSRYSGNNRILAWEVVNEPEYMMWDGRVDPVTTVNRVNAHVNLIHQMSTAYATVGSTMLDGLPFWTNSNLDFYQVHWYGYMSPGDWCAWCIDYAAVRAKYGINKPLVIGEFWDGDRSNIWNDWYNKGYAGAWAWSLFTERTSDGLQVNLSAMKTFTDSKNDDGPRAGVTGPTPTAVPPTVTATPRPPTPTVVAPTATPRPKPCRNWKCR